MKPRARSTHRIQAIEEKMARWRRCRCRAERAAPREGGCCVPTTNVAVNLSKLTNVAVGVAIPSSFSPPASMPPCIYKHAAARSPQKSSTDPRDLTRIYARSCRRPAPAATTWKWKRRMPPATPGGARRASTCAGGAPTTACSRPTSRRRTRAGTPACTGSSAPATSPGCVKCMCHLQSLPVQERGQAAEAMATEAQWRVQDPVYGCTGVINRLQEEIRAVQCELARTRAQLAIAVHGAPQGPPPPAPPQQQQQQASGRPVVAVQRQEQDGQEAAPVLDPDKFLDLDGF